MMSPNTVAVDAMMHLPADVMSPSMLPARRKSLVTEMLPLIWLPSAMMVMDGWFDGSPSGFWNMLMMR
jgi:hypothetical protein